MARTAKYEYWQSADGWHWHLRCPNGEIISSGEAYKTRPGCMRGIKAHRRYAGDAVIVFLPNPVPTGGGGPGSGDDD